jgi:hypothetical protein
MRKINKSNFELYVYLRKESHLRTFTLFIIRKPVFFFYNLLLQKQRKYRLERRRINLIKLKSNILFL